MHSASALKAAITDVLAVFPELEPRVKQHAGTLPGGQQQILAVAQALVGKRRFLLADEHSLRLSPLIVDKLMQVVEGIAQSCLGVLLIQQYASIALQIALCVYVLDRGIIRFEGSPDEIRATPNMLQTIYLSSEFGVAKQQP